MSNLYTSYLGPGPALPRKYCINLCINLLDTSFIKLYSLLNLIIWRLFFVEVGGLCIYLAVLYLEIALYLEVILCLVVLHLKAVLLSIFF